MTQSNRPGGVPQQDSTEMGTETVNKRAPLMTHPLVALGLGLRWAGLAGVEGSIVIDGDELALCPMTITAPGLRLVCENDLVCLRTDMPESVIAMMSGRTLAEIVELPSCGDDRVDEAAARATVMEACRAIDQEGQPMLQLWLSGTPHVELPRSSLA